MTGAEGRPEDDVDFFGMLDTATKGTDLGAEGVGGLGRVLAEEPADGRADALGDDPAERAPSQAPNPAVEPSAEPLAPARTSPVAESMHPPRHTESVTGIAGDENSVAGRDIDQSHTTIFQNYHQVFSAQPGEQAAEIARPRNRARSGQWDSDALSALAGRFVTPAGLLDASGERSALQILTHWHLVLITAEAKTGGQFTAALRLAQELRRVEDPSLIVRQEVLDLDFRLDAGLILDVDTPAVVILDLREASGPDVIEVRNHLVEFGHHLTAHHSYLVVILPVAQRRRFDERFPGRLHTLSRPPGEEVFARHVELVEDPQHLLDESGLLARVAEAWPPEAKELADAVSEARRAGIESAKEIAERIADPTDVLAEELRAEITRHQAQEDEEAIGLLLACGLFEGAPADRILAASDLVLGMSKTQVRHPDPLLRPGVTTTLKRLSPGLFNVRRRTFTLPDLGSSVLTYFWNEHPALRRTIREWLKALPFTIDDLGQAELERLADRAADLAAEAGVEVITELAQDWATGRRNRDVPSTAIPNSRQDQTRRSVAVRLLTRTAVDPILGRAVREKLWEWSRTSSPDLQLLVAIVCGEIGPDFPRVALTRIKHLATATEPLVRENASAAMVRVGRESGFATFLRYVEGWLDRPDADRMELLASSIERLLDAEPRNVTGEGVREFWSRALDAMPMHEIRRVVGAWLRHGARSASPSVRGDSVETLVAATEGRPQRMARLQWASRVAAIPLDPAFVEDDPVNALVQLVWTRLDEIDPGQI
ncbi:hypothetical protein [Actinoalloteichus sp. GBA129-24]|uniref:hypothetical protein n=1 Tax=Actinoalloteichus sp. GBA129-24 TaxID=1612551 RepID=UPI000950681E|nr:hypothetical protein [Actinoalloteichus sp. GBA129-24]APU22431.1 hypothetical protein UA75_22225 [Actinoalloteichus sp. GBA129-24]